MKERRCGRKEDGKEGRENKGRKKNVYLYIYEIFLEVLFGIVIGSWGMYFVFF